jgi:GT2 family glycosyltransferase
MTIIPVSVVMATKDRPTSLSRMLGSLLESRAVPEEVVIIDASTTDETETAIRTLFARATDGAHAIIQRAQRHGAAAQRNQGLPLASHEHVLFCDDDIICEPDCLDRLFTAMQSDPGIGGANAMIVNQSYSRPGRLLRAVLAAIAEPERESYAGRIIGPAIQFLPQDGVSMPATVPVQWLNTTCTLYRRTLLPDPPFDAFFTGYSLREDAALSLRVAKRARLVNVPAARIYHDSQHGEHKADVVALNRMGTANRHYVMTEVMEKRAWSDHARLILWECCQLGACAIQQRMGRTFWQTLRGKLLGFLDIALGRTGRYAR